MKRGKGQYSFEFLVTYGWALLILGIIVGAIYTFGWVDPANFLPQKCDFYGQIGCKDYYITPDSLNLSLINNFGVNLYLDGVSLIIDGKEVCKNSNQLISWKRSDYSFIGLDLNDPSCNANEIESEIIPGQRADILVQVSFFSNATCPACGGGSVGSCDSDCIHNSTGRVLVKVLE